jgi:hypothetical protein
MILKTFLTLKPSKPHPTTRTMKAVHTHPQHHRLIGTASNGKCKNRPIQYVSCKNNYNMQQTHYKTVYKHKTT